MALNRLPKHWTDYFFYPITPSHCKPFSSPQTSPSPEHPHQRTFGVPPTSTHFLSYTWGASHSPAYAFKTHEKFDPGLRNEILRAFGYFVWAAFKGGTDLDWVIGVPPRKSYQYGQQHHLDELLRSLDEVLRPQELRQALTLEGIKGKPSAPSDVTVKDHAQAEKLRNSRVLLVDNCWVTGQTARSVVGKIFELGAIEVHVAEMSRWLEGDEPAIQLAKAYRDSVCPDPSQIHHWYRDRYLTENLASLRGPGCCDAQ